MGQKQPHRAVHLLLPALILVHRFLLPLAWLVSLIIRHLCERSRLLNKLSLEALDDSQHTFTKEGEVEVRIFPLDCVEDLLSSNVDIGALQVEVLITLVEGPGGILSSLMLSFELALETTHFNLQISNR